MSIEELVQKNLVNGDTLELENLQVGDEGVKALAHMEMLAQVRRLELGDNEITDAGVAALMQSPHLGNVRVLNLKSNVITGEGAQAIANAPHLGNLEQLILKFNKIGDVGAKHLAASDFLKLNTLDLFRNEMGEQGVAAIKNSSFFHNLSRVRLD